MRNLFLAFLLTLLLPVTCTILRAAAPPAKSVSPSVDVTELSLEELFDMEVTLASKSPEKLSEVPTAIQVLTNEEIRRSGATTLPEALRLAGNLQVAQVNSHDWAITARGFNGAPLANNSLADKLLVMIDGRTVYTPLFGGVFWDVQQVMLEDVDHIEIVSGPGGTLWGSNAVNGVINVVTKSSKDTHGWIVSGAGGSHLQASAGVRYGGKVGDQLSYRVYGQYLEAAGTELTSGADAHDDWDHVLGGFRFDSTSPGANSWTVHGDYYDGDEGEPSSTTTKGYNVLGRFSHKRSNDGELSAQVYVDHTGREISSPSPFRDDLTTYDLDFQHRLPMGKRQRLLWGVGYRRMRDDASASFVPAKRTMDLSSAFVQDELDVVPGKLRLLAGVRLEHNDFSGSEVQPNLRLMWTPSAKQAMWAAVSRAVRSPTRLDADVVTPGLVGDPEFESEEVTSYELGYRVMPLSRWTLHLALFSNDVSDLRSVDLNTTPPPGLRFGNGQEADARGVELFTRFQLAQRWRLRASYVYLGTDIRPTDPLVVAGSDRFEAIDPHSHIMLQSLLELPGDVQLDVAGRWVDDLPASTITPAVPAYAAFDARIAWMHRGWEIALVGQNLGHARHPEFGTLEIPSGVYAKVAWRR